MMDWIPSNSSQNGHFLLLALLFGCLTGGREEPVLSPHPIQRLWLVAQRWLGTLKVSLGNVAARNWWQVAQTFFEDRVRDKGVGGGLPVLRG